RLLFPEEGLPFGGDRLHRRLEAGPEVGAGLARLRAEGSGRPGRPGARRRGPQSVPVGAAERLRDGRGGRAPEGTRSGLKRALTQKAQRTPRRPLRVLRVFGVRSVRGVARTRLLPAPARAPPPGSRPRRRPARSWSTAP